MERVKGRKVKRQHTKWEETLASHISDKELLSECIKNPYNSMVKSLLRTKEKKIFE